MSKFGRTAYLSTGPT